MKNKSKVLSSLVEFVIIYKNGVFTKNRAIFVSPVVKQFEAKVAMHHIMNI